MAQMDGVDADQLLKKADMALYAAKNGGGCDHRFFALRWRKQRRKGARSNSTCAKPWLRICSNSTSSHLSICALVRGVRDPGTPYAPLSPLDRTQAGRRS